MKKDIFIKSIFVFILIMIIFSIYSIPVLAGTFNANSWKPNDMTGMDALANRGNSIVGVIKTIGTVVAVVALATIGVKYVMGSIEEKAEYKKTMIPYLIGAVMVFAASNLVQIIYNWAIELNN